MPAPHRSTTHEQSDLASDSAASLPTSGTLPLPEPAPVSKHNLYVLIGCAVLAVLLVVFAPQIYPWLQETNPFGFYQ